MKKKFKDRVRIEQTEDGVTIWLDDLWILDASDFLNDRVITLDMKRLKQVNSGSENIDFTLKSKNRR